MGIIAKNINKKFGDFNVLKNVNLEVKTGELVALLGPSGSGKTTLLRIIAGLEFADSGTVLLNGEEAATKHVRERNVGFVFQHYALFKHMTVFENVAFGLRVRPKETRLSEAEIQQKVMELLRLVHLDSFHNRYPSQLSGGQRQRVALARALAVEPKVLLLDEPFGALDAKVRKELRRWMRRLHDDVHITSVFVTHDQEEAMEVADRIVVMSNGRIEQIGTPEEVYQRPASSFVYDFLGNYNEFEGWKDKDGNIHLATYRETSHTSDSGEDESSGWLNKYPYLGGLVDKLKSNKATAVAVPAQEPAEKKEKKETSRKSVKLFARPHETVITKTPDGNEYIEVKVVHINPAGPLVKIALEGKNSHLFEVEILKSQMDTLKLEKGDKALIRPKNVKVFE